MEDPVAEGSRLGKMAIQADAAADYKQAYFLYQECLKYYVEALKTENQDDRIDWTHDQILIRFERLAELNAWYKRKNLLESGWLELDDLRDRLESVAPKISTKLRKFSVPQTAQAAVNSVPPPDTAPASSVVSAGPAGGGYPSPPASEAQQPQKPTGYANPITPTSNASSTPTGPPYQGQHQPLPPPQQQPIAPQYNSPAGSIPPNPATWNNGTPTSEHDRKGSIATPVGHQVPQPSALGYPPQGANGVGSPGQYPQPNNVPPNPANPYGTSSPRPYGQPQQPQPQAYPPPQQQQIQQAYPPTNQDPNALARVGTFPAPQQPDPRTYLLTPFLRPSLPVKMYHCYGAAQRYRGGAEGWNIEIKDGSKNPIYYLYGLKQANAQLVEMSLHREDGKKTRCMDIYTPLREGRQSHNIGDMSYKHYLPTPVDIYSQGETIPNGPRRRIFTFNGRRFMWKPDAQGGGDLVNESLLEIDDGPNGYRPTGINGLLGDGKPLETKLAWYEHTMARKKLGRINVVAGLELAIEEIFLGTMLGHLCTGWERTRKGI
ncbi:hypothetical protein H072_1896 [Dactylellina haptotyla CBS 200.50]|uniref:MIT domain-containing protein n=1 Tax=Dactylellina haptotyla (strain CBS 200.50) TaxID=1284197 RepID=S8C8X5_DACHA|nr:hypothetical protein H072_1896 [Dactylellina haptotyla CBS 200.50]